MSDQNFLEKQDLEPFLSYSCPYCNLDMPLELVKKDEVKIYGLRVDTCDSYLA